MPPSAPKAIEPAQVFPPGWTLDGHRPPNVVRLLAQRVIDGEFDASPEESKAWAESPEGQETFQQLADDVVFGGMVRDMESGQKEGG